MNKDQALNRATFYLVYCSKNVFYDTTRKGSLHWSLIEAPESKYDLRKPKQKGSVHLSAQSSGCKTLNSMQAGLVNEKAKCAAMREYKKLHQTKQKPEPTKKPKRVPGKLNISHYGISVCCKRDRKLKSPVCTEAFNLVKDLNQHVCQKHKRFKYKC